VSIRVNSRLKYVATRSGTVEGDARRGNAHHLHEEFFKRATVAWPPAKQQLTIRLDADVLDWLKANGRGYQTRINHILRAAMESRPPHVTPPPKHGKRLR